MASKTTRRARRGSASARKPSSRVHPRVAAVLRDRVARHDLSPRETEVLEAAVRGDSRRAMLRSAGITLNTLKVHVRTLVRKLKARRLDDVVIGVLRDALTRKR